MTIHKLGWVVAAALAGGIFGVGFHAPGEKTGSVDIAKVFADCDLVKKQTESLKNQFTTRQTLVDFLKANPFITEDKMKRMRELSLKTTIPTAQEKTELEGIKTEATNNGMNLRAISQKEKPSPAELNTIEDMNKKKDAGLQVLERWVQEFTDEMGQKQANSRNEVLGKIQEAVAKVAKEQGYSVVFSKDAAPYAANDLTAETLKAANKMN